MSSGDHSADYSSILVLGYVLAAEFKQLNLDRRVNFNQPFNMKPSAKGGRGLGTGAYLKNKGGVGGDLGWAARRAVSVLGFADELTHLADPHGGHADVPRLDDLSWVQRDARDQRWLRAGLRRACTASVGVSLI